MDIADKVQCEQLQDDEIEVLKSIYPTSISTCPLHDGGKELDLSIDIGLASLTTTTLSTFSKLAGPSTTTSEISLTHLPPIKAVIHLPPDYPLQTGPIIKSLRAPLSDEDTGVQWLSKKHRLDIEAKLIELWDEEKELNGEGIGVLWRWWECLSTGDFLRDMSMYTQDDKLSLSCPPSLPLSTFHTLLKTFNATALHSSFEQTAFSCAICLENRKGKACIQMPNCDCVFCTPCLNSCWTLAIEEGTLENVSCPSVGCVKRRALQSTQENEKEQVEPELVDGVVGKALRERWQNLKDKRKAEIDPTYTICPRPTCQAAVPPPALPSENDKLAQAAISSRAIRLSDISKKPTPTPPAEPIPTRMIDTEDRWARYRLCPVCQYSFCLYCSATWHGPHTPCAFPQTSLIVQEYLSYPPDSPQRAAMEAKRGKSNLERMVNKYIEEEANKKWLETSTRPCSGCGVRVNKDQGCNHMTCGRCNAHFCYRCGSSLSPQDPYAHYRRPGHACYNRLFDIEEIERFERETAAGIAGIEIVDDNEWVPEPRGIWEW